MPPSAVPFPLDAPGLEDWHGLHRAAMACMWQLATALDRQGGPEVERACRWLQEQFRPHNEREERDLLPLLEAVGARDLGRQLSAEHREMSELSRDLLDGRQDGPVGLRARRLLDLVRQHIDTEEHVMLPLLQGLRRRPDPDAAGPGYLDCGWIYPRA
jgi:hypothetical protein